jgi:exopolysaccharide biosynthesis protein
MGCMRLARNIAGTVAALTWCLLFQDASRAEAAPPHVSWSEIKSGLETAHVTLHDGTVFSSSIVLVRATPARYAIRAIRATQFGWQRASVKALCKAAKAVACINSNFFDEQGRALGLVISRGIIHNKVHQGGGTLTGILYATDKEIRIAHRAAFSFNGVLEAVQAGPRLLASGLAVEGLKDSAPSSNLSGVCLDTQSRTVLFRVTSGVFGGSLHSLQKTLLLPGIGCTDALNFDGGGSSQLFISGEATKADAEESLSGEDDVPVALGVFESELKDLR